MSAINPASFVTPPTAGLPGPAGMNNPLYSQETQNDRRHQHEVRPYGGVRETESGRDLIPNPVGVLRNAFTESYQPFVQPQRSDVQPDAFAPYSPTNYGPLETGFSDYPAGSNGAPRMHPAQGEWMARFQGLSLNS